MPGALPGMKTSLCHETMQPKFVENHMKNRFPNSRTLAVGLALAFVASARADFNPVGPVGPKVVA